jgi:GLPGLI family protein
MLKFKRLIVIVIGLLLTLNAYSQSLKIQYQQQFENSSVNFDERYDLIIADTISIYIERERIGEHGLKGNENGEVFLFNKNQKIHRKYYLNLKEQFLFSEEYYSEPLLIKEADSLLNKQWTYIDTTKTINQYQCKLATKNFRGRSYNVWYTTDVRTNYGPWKFIGLPGLIIEAYDKKKEFHLKALNISTLNSQEKAEIVEWDILKNIKNQKVYSIEEFQNKVAEHRQIILNRISNSLPRNVPKNIKIDCEDCDEGLEKY